MKEFLNKREPIVVLKDFRFLNRQYAIGDLFDRRRVKIRNHILKRFMSDGFLCFAKFMKENELGSLGWIYDDSKRSRYPLVKISTNTSEPVTEEVEEILEDDSEEILEDEAGDLFVTEDLTVKKDQPKQVKTNKKNKRK